MRLPRSLRPFAAFRLRATALAAAAACPAAFLALATAIVAWGAGAHWRWGLRPASIPQDGGAIGWTDFARTADAVQTDGLAASLALISGVLGAAVAAALIQLVAGWAQHGLAARRSRAVRRALGERPGAARLEALWHTAGFAAVAGVMGGAAGWAAAAALAERLPSALARSGAAPPAAVAAGLGAALVLVAALAGLLPTIPRGRHVPAILRVGDRATEDPALGFARRAVASVQVAALVFAAGTIMILGGAVLTPDRDAWSALPVGDTVVARVRMERVGADELSALHGRLGPLLAAATGARTASASSPGTITGRSARDYVTTYCGSCVVGGLSTDLISVDSRRATVSPDFFTALGLTPIEGRAFGPQDRLGTPRVVIVSESYARRFDDGVPLGKRVMTSMTEPTWSTIVGVVPDLPEGGFAGSGDPVPSLYLPSTQALPMTFDVALREPANMTAAGERDGAALRDTLRAALVAELPAGAAVRVSEPRPLDQLLAEADAPARWLMLLLAAAAVPALLLAALGMASGMAEDARARAYEFGIRAALGAPPGAIARSVVRRGLAVGGRGLAGGMVLLVAADITLRDRIPAVRGLTPAAALALVLAVALLSVAATLAPARRLARDDPAEALTRRFP